VPTTAAATPVSARPLLQQGASGPFVVQLQQLLKGAGFDPGPTDGEFGARTRRAVERFQHEIGLDTDGKVGPLMWAALMVVATPNAVPATPPSPPPSAAAPKRTLTGDGLARLCPGSSGSAVMTLQRALKAQGYSPGSVDGKFGRSTDVALRQFQAAKGLRVDGIPGAATLRMLRVVGSGHDDFGSAAPRRLDVARPPAHDEAFRARVLEVARRHLGTDGMMQKLPRPLMLGLHPGCADFSAWLAALAGNDEACSCESSRQMLVAMGRWKGRLDPRPGDLVLFDWDQDRRADQIGLVKSVNADGTFTTIERCTGGRQGRPGVWEKIRTLEFILGFGNPA
jgi:peptidoglycan hydrolase-like protein with peptidoglycan-binding domain